MRLSLLTIIVTLLCCLNSTAQISVELGGGPSFSRSTSFRDALNKSTFDRRAHISDIYFYGNIGYKKNDHLTFILEGQYNVGGYKDFFDNQAPIKEISRKTKYITLVPKANWIVNNYLDFQVGPYLGFRMGEQYKIDDQEWQTNDIVEATSATDIGISLGVRAHIQRYSLTVAMQHGITSLESIDYTDANGIYLDTHNSRTAHFQVGLGYRLF